MEKMMTGWKGMFTSLALVLMIVTGCSQGNLTSENDIPATVDLDVPDSLYDSSELKLKAFSERLTVSASPSNYSSDDWGYKRVRDFVTIAKVATKEVDRWLGKGRTNWRLMSLSKGQRVAGDGSQWFFFNTQPGVASNAWFIYMGSTGSNTNLYIEWTMNTGNKFKVKAVYTPTGDPEYSRVVVLYDNNGTYPYVEAFTEHPTNSGRVAAHYRIVQIGSSPLAVQVQARVSNDIAYPRSFECAAYAVLNGTNGIAATGIGIVSNNSRLTLGIPVTLKLDYREYFGSTPLVDGPIWYAFAATNLNLNNQVGFEASTNGTEPASVAAILGAITPLTNLYYE